jgi:hypothetical protein
VWDTCWSRGTPAYDYQYSAIFFMIEANEITKSRSCSGIWSPIIGKLLGHMQSATTHAMPISTMIR